MAPQKISRSTCGSAMIALLVLVGLASRACATTYVVGGTSGWTELAPGSISYDDEFQNIPLYVGDFLQFSAAPGNQSVLRVPKDQLANCDGTNFLASVNTSVTVRNEDGSLAPSSAIPSRTAFSASILLNDTGYWGFISADEEQCRQGGMHLAVNVVAPAPGSAPSTSVAPVNPPPVTALASALSPSSPTPSPSPIYTPPSLNRDDSNGANGLVSASSAMLLAFAVASLAIIVR